MPIIFSIEIQIARKTSRMQEKSNFTNKKIKAKVCCGRIVVETFCYFIFKHLIHSWMLNLGWPDIFFEKHNGCKNYLELYIIIFCVTFFGWVCLNFQNSEEPAEKSIDGHPNVDSS